MDTEDELEDELQKLDIKDDLGEESDVTPTNTPTSSTPTILHVPQSSNILSFYEGNFTRFSSNSDYDMRTDSSLSWGEDEFEGEATRIVSALFNQLDQIVYSDSSIQDVKFPHIYSKSVKDTKHGKKDRNEKQSRQGKDFESKNRSLSNRVVAEERISPTENNGPNIPSPSKSLIVEIKEWVNNFPHFRVTGVGIDICQYDQIESELLADFDVKSSKCSKEETFALDGDYENKLQLLSLKPPNNKDIKKEKKTKGSQSRICSGSMDPELLKEHILIKLFDHMWPLASQIVEPLLNQYAQFLIKHSAMCSSLSRGSSTVNERELPNILLDAQRRPTSYTVGSFPSDGWNALERGFCSSRPSSSIHKLSNKGTIRDVSYEDVASPLLISKISSPFSEERSKSASKMRESSANSLSSLPALPSLTTFHRPVSSKSRNHLLRPMPTVGQRPVSTSSFTRLRYNDKFSKLNESTIDEGVPPDKEDTYDLKMGNLSPPWSRHNSFLPRIHESKTNKIKMHVPSAVRTGDLNVYSKSLSAKSRTRKGVLETTKKYPNEFYFFNEIPPGRGSLDVARGLACAKEPVDCAVGDFGPGRVTQDGGTRLIVTPL